MELWIRTQDRSMIIKINNIFMREYNSQADNIFHKFAIASSKDNSCDHIILGIYEKERALEILNEIQTLLICKKIINLNNGVQRIESLKLDNIVYEMPGE